MERAWLGIMAACLLAAMAGGTRAGGSWKGLKTDDFTVFYPPGGEADAREVLGSFEDAKASVTPWTGSLALGLPVTLEDAGLMANGFADPVYYQVHLFRGQPSVSNLMGVESWWELVSVHEYAHMCHMTATGGSPAVLSAIFGHAFAPNIFSPMWLTEGLATNVESSISPFEGRLNDGFFDAYILARAKDGRLPSPELASIGPLEFPEGTGVYLYGSEFLSWVARTRGANGAFPRFVQVNGSRVLSFVSPILPCLGVDRSARVAFGARFPALWKEWQQEMTAKAAAFSMDGEQVTRTGWYYSGLVAETNRLTYQRTIPVKTAPFEAFRFEEIVERDLATGRERVLVSTTAGFMARPVRRGHTLWYATAELGRRYANTSQNTFGVETRIHEHDLATGRDRKLAQGRYRCFTVLPDGRLLLARERRGAFGTELVALDPAGPGGTTIMETDLLVDELVADDKRVVATARAEGENFSLFEADLAARELRPLVRTPFLEGTPALDGDRLLYAANYGQVYSIYTLDLATREVTRLTEGGFAVCPAVAGDRLWFVGLNSWGFDLYGRKIEPREAALPADQPFVRAASTFDPATARPVGYASNLATMVPALRAPYIDYLKDTGGPVERSRWGVMISGKDAIGEFASYGAFLAYDALTHRPVFDASLTSAIAAPWQVSAAGANMEGRRADLAAAYPLFMGLSPGLTGLSAGGAVSAYDDWTRRSVAPFGHADFRWPVTRFSADVVAPWERTNWGSAVQGSSLFILAALTQYVAGGQFALSALSVADAGNLATTVTPIRGYRDDVVTASAALFSVDLTHPLCRIHAGLWNPSFYVEDLVVGAFGDAFTPRDRAALYSGGLELHLETWISNMGLPLDWGGRVAVNRDRKWSGEVFAGTTLAGPALRNLPHEIRGAVRSIRGLSRDPARSSP
ncbi:MAG: hypothetical protein AAB152_12780 [Candidatus Coatesbacteria bacterium]